MEWLSAYKIPLMLAGISAFLIILSVSIIIKSTQSASPIQFSSGEATTAAQIKQITIQVDIEGAVMRPGVYQLPLGSRVEDALSAAGGLTGEADSQYVQHVMNRAMKLVDGAKLFIPKQGGSETSHIISTSSTVQGQSQNGIVTSVNFASESQLDALPGVGPVTAKKIIGNRPYQTLDELVTKKTMGQSLFEKLKDTLSL